MCSIGSLRTERARDILRLPHPTVIASLFVVHFASWHGGEATDGQSRHEKMKGAVEGETVRFSSVFRVSYLFDFVFETKATSRR